MYRILLLVVVVCLGAQAGVAQSFTIHGKVVDADTQEGIPFCNVYFEGTTLGVSSELDGTYEISIKSWHDSLTASAIGYNSLAIALSKDSIQTIDFALSVADLTLAEVVVLAGENPANAIVRGIIKHKNENRMEAIPTLQFERYSKTELDIENIPPKLRGNKLMKPFDFVFDHIDSTSDEKPFLPIYLNETLTEVYQVKKAGNAKEFIKAQRTSGLDNQTMIENIKKIHEPFSIYDNWIYVLDKGFISPFANGGLSYYEYYILDSAYINGQWSYQLKFKPKRKQEDTFYGDFWVADTTFAIQRVNMRMSPNVNINLVNRIIIYQEFDYIENHWLPIKEKMVVDLSPAKKMPGMIGRNTKTFRDYQLNQPTTRKYFMQEDPDPFFSELNNDESYWAEVRHEPLEDNESGIYALVDSVQNAPAFKTYQQVLETVFTGYLEIEKLGIEVGPYYSLISSNLVEGTRLRFGARTFSKFSETIRLGGSIAYGTKDQEYKYSGEFKWLMSKQPRRMLGINVRKDISLSSENSEEFLESDLFSGLFRRNIVQKLIKVEEGKIFYEHYWKKGWSNRFTLLHRNMDPYGGIYPDGGGFNYAYLSAPDEPNRADTTIATTEFIFKTRFALEEDYVDYSFDRVSYGSEYPIIEFQYTAGFKGFLGGDYQYHKLSLYYRHYININPIGWLAYRFKVGKVFGTVPFLLMEVHPGNESIFMTRGIFNTMNRYEFASDLYFNWVLEHHFDGFILDRIPLIRKLKWRTVATFKGVIGQMSDANRAANALNLFHIPETETYNGFRAPSEKPYMEVGVGIENIFKVIRIDAVWRLNYLDNPEANHFGLVAGMYFFF